MTLATDNPGQHQKANHYKSLQRAAQVFEALFEDDFQGKATHEVAEETGIPDTVVWRILKTWSALGWVVQIPEPGHKAIRWRVSTRLAHIAWAYERDAFQRVQQIEQEYQNVTGKELRT